MRVTAIDFSLTSTGLASISDSGVYVQRVQSKPSGDNLPARSRRMRALADEAFRFCRYSDLVVIEGPAYASDTGKAHDRSGCWWMIVGRLTGQEVPVVEVPPSTMKVWALGVGGGKNAGKDMVLAETINTYGHLVRITGNDVADALQLCTMGWAHLTGNPLVSLPEKHTRALKAVRWADR